MTATEQAGSTQDATLILSIREEWFSQGKIMVASCVEFARLASERGLGGASLKREIWVMGGNRENKRVLAGIYGFYAAFMPLALRRLPVAKQFSK